MPRLSTEDGVVLGTLSLANRNFENAQECIEKLRALLKPEDDARKFALVQGWVARSDPSLFTDVDKRVSLKKPGDAPATIGSLGTPVKTKLAFTPAGSPMGGKSTKKERKRQNALEKAARAHEASMQALAHTEVLTWIEAEQPYYFFTILRYLDAVLDLCFTATYATIECLTAELATPSTGYKPPRSRVGYFQVVDEAKRYMDLAVRMHLLQPLFLLPSEQQEPHLCAEYLLCLLRFPGQVPSGCSQHQLLATSWTRSCALNAPELIATYLVNRLKPTNMINLGSTLRTLIRATCQATDTNRAGLPTEETYKHLIDAIHDANLDPSAPAPSPAPFNSITFGQPPIHSERTVPPLIHPDRTVPLTNPSPPPNPEYNLIANLQGTLQALMATCFYCGVPGHFQIDCRKRIREKADQRRVQKRSLDKLGDWVDEQTSSSRGGGHKRQRGERDRDRDRGHERRGR
jgi:hypothetical protein